MDLPIAVQDQVWATVAVRSHGGGSGDRANGSDHASEGSDWESRFEQFPAAARLGLERNWNINQIPLSIALGGDRALQDTVFQAQQNYLWYPQFGTINLLSNFNHNTWHSGNITVEKRYSSGITLNASFNFSKSLSN